MSGRHTTAIFPARDNKPSDSCFCGDKTMKVSKQRSVDAAIRTLSEEDRRKVLAWLGHLENWQNDEQVRKMSKQTIYQDVYVRTWLP
jgi:hypothetical protein